MAYALPPDGVSFDMLLTAKEYWFNQAKVYEGQIACAGRAGRGPPKILQENSTLKQHLDMPSRPAASECQADQQLRNAKRPRVVKDEAPEVEHLDDKEDMEGQEEEEVEEEEEKLLPFPWQKYWNCEYSTWYYHNVQDGSSVWAEDFVVG